MSPLLKILGGGLAVFMTLAMVQEWDVFDRAWLGAPKAAPPLPETERKAAADTVYRMLRLMEHLYGSGGDPRFIERLPASAAVVEEIRADVEYLRQNHRRQEISLDRLDVTAIEARGPDDIEIETRETWSVRIVWAEEGTDTGSEQRQRVHARYRLARGNQGWRVEGWDPSEPWRPFERPSDRE